MKNNKTEKRISQFVPIEKCKPNQWNPNRMNKKEFDALKLSIKEHGQTKPIQDRPIKDGYEILGGYHTWLAMKELGFLEVEINLRKLNDDDAKIFGLQDNISGQDDIMRLGQLVYELVHKGYSIKKIAQVYGEAEESLKDALKIVEEDMDKKLKKLKEELARENLVELAFIVDEKPKDQIKQFVKDVTKFAETRGAEVVSAKEKINPKKVTVNLITLSVTAPQSKVINRAIEKLVKDEKVSRSRALELICADFMAGN
jgi:ParB/RepB/Spo0J family partition protein